MDLDALDELFAVLAGEVQRKSAERARLRRDGARREPGLERRRARTPSTSKNEDGVASGVPAIESPSGVAPGALHGVKSVVVTAGPQTAGLSSGARGPPLKWTFSSLNGACGFSMNFVVSWPVAGFASTYPAP